jgi:hypothetical protein
MGRLTEFQQPSLPIDFEPKGQFEPVSFLREGAKRFSARAGRSFDTRGLADMQADSNIGANVAQAYKRLPHFEEGAVPHFEAMRRETAQQYDYLTKPRTAGGLGVNVQVTDSDPYKSPQEMVADITQNRQLKVFSTAMTGGHPFFTNEENDQFRAVHDAFGHAAIGRGFSRNGEEAAFHAHAQMYSPEALPALTTETRGQNSALNYGGGQGFDVQKVAKLGPQFTDQQPRINGLGVRRAPV